MADPDVGPFVGDYHDALNEFFRGDPEPVKALLSHGEDVSLANPFGPVAIGWEDVEGTMERAASNYSDGRATNFEPLAMYVTHELAYLVEIERFEARAGSQEELASGALRITTPRAAESVIQR